MAKITIKDFMEAGVHFGHQTKRWNPKMKKFVYGSRNGISIIDLTKTMRMTADACNFLQKKVSDGGRILFVGTKRQAQQLIKDAAEKTDMFAVSERWLGGTLTNNVTIRKSISRMYEIDRTIGSDEANSMKKKEIAGLNRTSTKLHRDLDGIADMRKLPDVMVVVDVCHDDIAVREAIKLKIPIVAIVDTNGDPDNIDFPIPANDDAVRSIKIIMDLLTDSVKVASEIYGKKVMEQKAKAEAEKAAKEAEAKEKAEQAKEKAAAKKAAAKKPAAKKPAAKKAESEKAPKAEDKAPKAEGDKKEKVEEAKEEKKAAPKKAAAKKPAAKKAAPKKAAAKKEEAPKKAEEEK
jgi:small subunit ribosomal protein S2